MEKKMEHQLHVLDTARPTHKKKRQMMANVFSWSAGYVRSDVVEDKLASAAPKNPDRSSISIVSLSLCAFPCSVYTYERLDAAFTHPKPYAYTAVFVSIPLCVCLFSLFIYFSVGFF